MTLGVAMAILVTFGCSFFWRVSMKNCERIRARGDCRAFMAGGSPVVTSAVFYGNFGLLLNAWPRQKEESIQAFKTKKDRRALATPGGLVAPDRKDIARLPYKPRFTRSCAHQAEAPCKKKLNSMTFYV